MSFLKFQADNIFTGTEMLGPKSVLVTDEKGIIHDIIDEEEAGEGIQKFSGIISPGFINCHCHLELSHLKGLIPEHTGMVDFILNIMQKRASSEELIQDAIEKAEGEMINNGIVAVGDICNTKNTINQKKEGNLYYHNFVEISGFVPQSAQQRFDAGLEVYTEFAKCFPNNSTLVPHAPYSVSKNLFELINNFSQSQISTIHNQESKEENDFFEFGNGDFKRLYKELGIDISFHKPSHKSSLGTVINYLLKPSKTILVHNTYTSFSDVAMFGELNSDTQFYLCLCVLSNRYITNSLPTDVVSKHLVKNIVLGTDSLASNKTLNILAEIQELLRSSKCFSLSDLLQMATFNGALALGIDSKYGDFNKGKQPGIILLKDVLTKTGSVVLLK